MPVSKKGYDDRINTLISSVDSVNDAANLAGAYTALNNVDFPTYANPSLLPAASENTGRWVYVTSIQQLLFSDGISWINDFTSDARVTKNIFVFGTNTYGQLGTDNTINYSSPVKEVSASSTWSSVGVGQYHTSAIKTNGTLWSWGRGVFGALGTDDVISYSSPVQEVSSSTTWSSVSCGTYYTSAIKTDGTLWGWGYNNSGQLGTGDVIWASSPVQEVSSSTTWSSVSCGTYYTSAIKTDGTLWAWGINSNATLGTDDVICYSSPVQEVSGSTNWSSVNSGPYHTSAIKTDGTLWSWGNNLFGHLGTDDVINYSSPVQEVSGSTNWSSVSCGTYYTPAIKTDGTLWTWGYNSVGQLGTGDVVSYSSPVQEVSNSTNWSSVSGGGVHIAAIKTDGTLWAWGKNASGELGTGNVTCYSSPVQEVSSSTTWSSVSSGPEASHSAVIFSGSKGF